MAKVIPFKAVRPSRNKVHLICSRPFYTYKKSHLKAKLESNPYSFLHVINPEFNQPHQTQPNSPGRFKKVKNKYEEFKKNNYLFKDESFTLEAIGKSAQWIAEQAGIRVNPSTKILVPIVISPGQDDLLFREKLCPVLTLTAAVDFEQAITFAKHTTKRGAGHSAAFHGNDALRLVAFSQDMPVYRVVVNAPCSQGAAGFATHLPPAFTIGTGFAGRSSVGENVGPHHLVHWTRIAYAKDQPADLASIDLSYVSSDRPVAPVQAYHAPQPNSQAADVTRDELRQLILEELRGLKGDVR